MNTVLIVAKAPVAGLVKTRLTSAYTCTDAARFAAAALRDTLEAALAVPGARCAVALGGRLDDAVDSRALGALLAHCTVFPQVEGGLGARLADAHRRAAGTGPVLQIGMDTPQVTPGLLASGLDAARERTALGPAADGGWWALGVPAGAAGRLDCLAHVPMSTDRTGEATRNALTSVGLPPDPLPELWDVDHPRDVAAVAATCAPGSAFRRLAAELAGVGSPC